MDAIADSGHAEFKDFATTGAQFFAQILTQQPELPLKLFFAAMAIFTQLNYEADRVADLKNSVPTDGSEWDFIVVGSGSAGSVLAKRLIQSPQNYRVLVLEAGAPAPVVSYIDPISTGALLFTPYDWNYTTTPQEQGFLNQNKQAYIPRGRLMGGSGSMNTMVYLQGNPKDYDRWADLTGDPIWANASVAEHGFCKHEHYTGEFGVHHGCGGDINVEGNRHQSAGSEYFLKAKNEFTKSGIFHDRDCNQGQNQDGCINIVKMDSSCGIRWSSNTALVASGVTKNTERHRIQPFSQVTRLIFDEKSCPPRAIGVEYVSHYDPNSDPSKEVKVHKVYAAKEVILSAGALNSPHILLNSGVGPKADLEELGIKVIADRPCGKGLQDHVGTYIYFRFPKSCNASFILERDALNSIKEHLQYEPETGCLGRSFLQGTPYIGTSFSSSSKNKDSNYPDYQYLFTSYGISPLWGSSIQETEEELAEDLKKPCPGASDGFVDATQLYIFVNRPKSVGSITLNKDCWKKVTPHNYLCKPDVDPKYFSDDEGHDLAVLVEATWRAWKLFVNSKTFGDELGATLVRGTECEDFAPAGNVDNFEFWKCYVLQNTMSVYHVSRSCKMGRLDDPEASVDSKLRVIGVQGVRVADCSIMPVIPNSNTNGPAMMVGEMAAKIILEDHKAAAPKEPAACKICSGNEKPLKLAHERAEELERHLVDFRVALKAAVDQEGSSI